MKKILLFYIAIIFSVFQSSCKGQDRTDEARKSPPALGFELPKNIFAGAPIDTLASPFAPQSIVRTIIQDRNENIWIASWDGMIKYDGNSFTNITRGVSDSRFFSVIEDRLGHFWFASIGSGVYHYDGNEFENFTTKEGLANNRVTNIYEDKSRSIWFGTEGGISLYNGVSFQNFTEEDGLCANDVNSVIEDDAGAFWISTRGAVCKYDPLTSSFSEITHSVGKSFYNVRHIIQDSNGNMWLGGQDGLWRYKDNTFMNYSQDFVGYIYEDMTGNIWTSSGLHYSNQWKLSVYEGATRSNEVVSGRNVIEELGMLFGIAQDVDNNLWYGTLNGVYRFDHERISYFMGE